MVSSAQPKKLVRACASSPLHAAKNRLRPPPPAREWTCCFFASIATRGQVLERVMTSGVRTTAAAHMYTRLLGGLRAASARVESTTTAARRRVSVGAAALVARITDQPTFSKIVPQPCCPLAQQLAGWRTTLAGSPWTQHQVRNSTNHQGCRVEAAMARWPVLCCSGSAIW
jgi:hypothetical protein